MTDDDIYVCSYLYNNTREEALGAHMCNHFSLANIYV